MSMSADSGDDQALDHVTLCRKIMDGQANHISAIHMDDAFLGEVPLTSKEIHWITTKIGSLDRLESLQVNLERGHTVTGASLAAAIAPNLDILQIHSGLVLEHQVDRESLVEALRGHNAITKLDLQQVIIKEGLRLGWGNAPPPLDVFVPAFSSMTFLLHLEISCADHPPVEKPQFSAQALAAICQLAGLRKLNFSNVGLDDEHFGVIAQQISQKSNCLTELFLNENHNTDRGLDIITTLIIDNPFSPLQKFQAYQSHRAISDESLYLIIEAFRQNCTLTGLWLHTTEPSQDVEFYLQLNQVGRQVLVDKNATHTDWIQLMVTSARDPPLLYYVVQNSNFWWQFIAKGGTSSKYDFFRQGSELASHTHVPAGKGLSQMATSTKGPSTRSGKSSTPEPPNEAEQIAYQAESYPVLKNLVPSINVVEIDDVDGTVIKSDPIVDGHLGIEAEGPMGLFRMISKPFLNQPQSSGTAAQSSSKSSKQLHTDVGNDLFSRMKNASDSRRKGETKERRSDVGRAQINQKSLAEQRADQELLLREKLKELDPDLEGAMLAQKETQQLLVQKIVSETKTKIVSDQDSKSNGNEREEWKKFLDQDDFYVDEFPESPDRIDDISIGNLSTGSIPSVHASSRVAETEPHHIKASLVDDLRGARRRKHAWNQEVDTDPAPSAVELNKDRQENADTVVVVDEKGRIPHFGEGDVETTEKISGEVYTSIESTSLALNNLDDTLTLENGNDVPLRSDRSNVNPVFPELATQYTPDTQRDRYDIKGISLSQTQNITYSIDEASLKIASENRAFSQSNPKTNQDADAFTLPWQSHSDQRQNSCDEGANISSGSKAKKKVSKKTKRGTSPTVDMAHVLGPEAVSQTTEIATHATYGMAPALGVRHGSVLGDATEERATIIVLLSRNFGSHSQMSNQNRAIVCLRSRQIPFVEVDGSDPLSRSYRDQLFDISGIRGLYPQFFVRSEDDIAYLGEFDAFETMNESNTFPLKVMTAMELKDIRLQLLKETCESDETNPFEEDVMPEKSSSSEICYAQPKILVSAGSEPSLRLEDVFSSSASSHSLPSKPGHQDAPNETSTPRQVETRISPQDPNQSSENSVGSPSSPTHKASIATCNETKKKTSNLPTADKDAILQEPALRDAIALSSAPVVKATTVRTYLEIPKLTGDLLPCDTKTVRTDVPAISEEEREKEQTKKEFERIKAIEKLEEARREAAHAKRLLYADFENTVALTSMPPPLLDTKTLVLLISKRTESHAQRANQARAHTILSSHGLKYGVVDGSDPESEKWRDELLKLSGMKNAYPQLFLIDDETIEFLGDFNKLLEMNESGLLNGSLIEKPPEEVKHRWQPRRGEEPPKAKFDDAFAEAESAHARFGIAAFEAEMKLQEEISQLRAEMARKEKAESEVRAQLAAQLVKLKAREAHQQETQTKAKQLLEDAVKKRANEEKRRKVAEKARKQAESELVRQQTLLKELREREEAEMTRIRSDEGARRSAEKEARCRTEEEIQKRIEAEARIVFEETARQAAELELQRLRGILRKQESSQETIRNVNATLAIQKTIKALREAEVTASQKAEEEARLRAKEAKRRLEMERARKKAELELLRLKKDIVRKQKIDKLRAEEEAEVAREQFQEEKRLRLIAEQELEILRATTSSSRGSGYKTSRKENVSSNEVVISVDTVQRATKARESSSLLPLPRGRSEPRKVLSKDKHRVLVSESPNKDPTSLRKLQSMEEKLQQLKEAKLKQEQAKTIKHAEKKLRLKSPQSLSAANHDVAVTTGESARLLAIQKKLTQLKARQARTLQSTS